MKRIGLKSLTVYLVLTGVAVCGVVGTRAAHGSALPSDRVVIEQLVHASQLAEQTLCLAPTTVTPAHRVAAMSSDVVAAARANVDRVERELYTGDELAGMTGPRQRSCAAALTGGYSLQVAGGVSPVACTTIAIAGNTAHATCELVKWLRSLIRRADGHVVTVQPRGLDIVNDDFVRSNGVWRISAETLAPAPGSGP